MKRIAILGVTGSIGTQSVDVCLQHPEDFEVVACSAGNNMSRLQELLEVIHPEIVCVKEGRDAYHLSQIYGDIQFIFGEEGLIQIATYENADLILNALVGFAGLKPTLAAIDAKKEICLANKETLVVAGALVKEKCLKNKVSIVPIDSEHSAILQCLRGNKKNQVKRLLITASGGSFRDKSREELKSVSKEDALRHPNWSMGAKITIDSATMMNKGFEVIEAHWLFNVDMDDIDVVMHKESVIHSMVEFNDGAVIAQLGSPDMRLPIQYALTYPNRYELNEKPFDITDFAELHFAKPDFQRYPLLELAYNVGRAQGNLPAVMNAANEEAVRMFLNDEITFLDIERLVIGAVNSIEYVEEIDLDTLIKYDKLAREFVRNKGVRY